MALDDAASVDNRRVVPDAAALQGMAAFDEPLPLSIDDATFAADVILECAGRVRSARGAPDDVAHGVVRDLVVEVELDARLVRREVRVSLFERLDVLRRGRRERDAAGAVGAQPDTAGPTLYIGIWYENTTSASGSSSRMRSGGGRTAADVAGRAR